MTRNVLLLAALGLCIFAAPQVTADVLLIEEVRQSERLDLPANGTSQQDVRARYGEPSKTHSPVGDPPITRWDFDGWSVYFEYGVVLFTVLHKGHVIDKG